MLQSTLEGGLKEKQISNTYKWIDVAAQRYSSPEDSQRGFCDSCFSPQLAGQCRGNTLLLSMPALPSKHLPVPHVSAKKHPTVGWICINKQLLCSKLPLALHPPGRQKTLGVKSSFLLLADLLVAYSVSAHRPAFQTFTSTQRNHSLKSFFSTQHVIGWTWLQYVFVIHRIFFVPTPTIMLMTLFSREGWNMVSELNCWTTHNTDVLLLYQYKVQDTHCICSGVLESNFPCPAKKTPLVSGMNTDKN